MRTIVTNYTFTPGAANAGKVVLNGYTSIQQANVLLILDATNNNTIYNPTTLGLGGTVSGNTVTLALDTSSGYSSSDVLVIFYEDLSVPASTYVGGFLERMLKKLGLLSFSASATGAALNVNVSNTPNVNVSNTPAVTVSSGTITAVTTITNPVSTTQGNLVTAAGQSQAYSNSNFQNSFRQNLTPL